MNETINSKPKTFGDLYTEIQKGALLTPEEEDSIQQILKAKY